MNIRPRARATLRSDNPELPPIQARFATLKVATGMLVPAFDAGGLRTPKDSRPTPICRRREKVFGPGRAVPLDRNAKARIAAYARSCSARNRQPRQHRGPITSAVGAASQ